ncbi:MAG: hypothetical protein FJ087_16940, partial [Deltaproteobacteria bacterium]|nr:hypothetical protein [Deltaproteobacteria bacterium]
MGVPEGTIDDDRVAILQGVAYKAGSFHTMEDREPLADVEVTVENRPGYGSTRTGPDGRFVMVVNAGEDLLLHYEKDGYLPVQRRVSPRPRDWGWVEDVVATPETPAMMQDGQAGATVSFSTTNWTVRKGLQQTDGDGTRQAFVFFPPGVTANLRLRDHPDIVIPQPGLTGFGIREYTVGEIGRQALPLPLPPNSAYTYAVEITCDAPAGGEVRFTQPVYVYVHNFTDFPVGSAVPSGYVDKASGTWIASDNGRVVKTLQFWPHVDATGSGADSGWAEIGMTLLEAQALWQAFGNNAEVWRIPITHFLEMPVRWTSHRTYDGQGRLRGWNQQDRERRWTYDEHGYPKARYAGLESEIPDSDDPDLLPAPLVDRVNDLSGWATRVTREDGGLVSYVHDRNGNTEAITPPGEAAHEVEYTPVNLLESHAAPNYSATTWAYNSLRLPTVTTRASGSVITRSYDSITGKLGSIQTPEGTIDVTSGPEGRIDAVEVPVVGTTRQSVAFAFDGPLLLSETWSGTGDAIAGTMTYAYDSRMCPASTTFVRRRQLHLSIRPGGVRGTESPCPIP